MDRHRVPAVLATAIGVAGAVGALVTATRLTLAYHPHAPGAAAYDLPADHRWVLGWSQWYDRSVAALVVAAAILVVVQLLRRPLRPSPVAAGVAAVVLASVAGRTRRSVAWDQLALWSVTVGTDIDGYRFAATGADVRFVIVRGAEVSQGAYAAMLAVHLSSCVLAIVALAFAARAALRPAGEDEEPAPPVDATHPGAVGTPST